MERRKGGWKDVEDERRKGMREKDGRMERRETDSDRYREI